MTNEYSAHFIRINLTLLLSLALFASCDPEIILKLYEEKAKKIPIAISFLDVNVLQDKQDVAKGVATIPNVEITFIDPYKVLPFSRKGKTKRVKVLDGILGFELPDNIQLPYEFALKIEATGYISTHYSIRIKDKQPYYFPIYLVNISSPPKGISIYTDILSNSGSAIPVSKNITSGNGNLVIPAGTKLKNEKNESLSSNKPIEINFSSITPNRVSSRSFPAGIIIPPDQIYPDFSYKFFPKYKKILTLPKPYYLQPYAWINLEMKAGDEKVTYFDKPIQSTLTFLQDSVNTLPGSKDKDSIMVWSLNDSGVWIPEGKTVLRKVNGQYSATFDIDHLSTWALAEVGEICTTDLVIRYESDVAQTLHSELVLNPTGHIYIPFIGNSRVSYAATSGSISIANAPKSSNVNFVVYEPGPMLAAKRNKNILTGNCGISSGAPLDLRFSGSIDSTKIVFKIETATGSELLCNYPVWVKLCNGGSSSLSYEFLGRTDLGYIKMLRYGTPNVSNIWCLKLWYGTELINDETGEDFIEMTIDLAEKETSDTIVAKIGLIDTLRILHSYDSIQKVHELKILKDQPIPVESCH